MPIDLSIQIGDVRLKNPVICGSGEHLIERDGIVAALEAGAAAVVMKSTNESEAAKQQLGRADYALLDTDWRLLPWEAAPPRGAHFFCRSGLSPLPFEDWLALLADTDALAKRHDAYVVASLIPADMDEAPRLARRMQEAGARILEFNIGAPHAGEAAKGAITLERDAARVRAMSETIRAAVDIPLWIKLTSQSEDAAALALAAKEGGADAVTLMGRFMAMVPDLETQEPLLGTAAAMGGAWALPLTCRWLALARRTIGPDFPLMGTNGARDGLDVARFMLAGASAVQMTSAVMTGGFEVVEDSLAQLYEYLARKGEGAAAIVGRAADRMGAYQDQPFDENRWRRYVPQA